MSDARPEDPMHRQRLLIAALITGLAAARSARAQSGGAFDLTWNSLDGGGQTFSTGGTFDLGGTIGQPDAGPSTGGTFALYGGFWGRTPVAPVAVPPEPERPSRFALLAPAPNPFAGLTALAVDLPVESAVRLDVFDVTGQRVARLADARLPAGRHRFTWDARDASGVRAAAGLYFVVLDAGGFRASSRLVLVH
jgi:hypothetical protein